MLAMPVFFLLLTSTLWAQSFVAKPLSDLGSAKYKGFPALRLYENERSNEIPMINAGRNSASARRR